MKMRRRQYRIGELAKTLNLKRFVVRFWEKELGIKPRRSPGGQRFYQAEDFETFKLIKELVYEKKFTLAGAKKELENLKKNKHKTIVASQKVVFEEKTVIKDLEPELKEQMLSIKKQLVKLKELL